jgi:TATA-box binding protein (TBP) (component of TFIID and TFIIIB)
MAKPTAYKISTITATAHVNSVIDLPILFDSVIITGAEEDGVVYAELGKDICKGQPRRKRSKRKAPSKHFDNQVTLLLRIKGKFANCKMFKNGCVQITGLKRIEEGCMFVERIIEQVRLSNAAADPASLHVKNYLVRLINTDFRTGFEIRRDNFFQYMLDTYPKMYSAFEPCIYTGVKIHFYHNQNADQQKDGLCRCPTQCGIREHDVGKCKKITIAVFRSGCILVTGGSEYKQIDDAYTFICDVLEKCKDQVRKEVTVKPSLT